MCTYSACMQHFLLVRWLSATSAAVPLKARPNVVHVTFRLTRSPGLVKRFQSYFFFFLCLFVCLPACDHQIRVMNGIFCLVFDERIRFTSHDRKVKREWIDGLPKKMVDVDDEEKQPLSFAHDSIDLWTIMQMRRLSVCGVRCALCVCLCGRTLIVWSHASVKLTHRHTHTLQFKII